MTYILLTNSQQKRSCEESNPVGFQQYRTEKGVRTQPCLCLTH